VRLMLARGVSNEIQEYTVVDLSRKGREKGQ
jgi:hypothetical protein